MSKKLEEGDIFSIKVSAKEYVFGRILFDGSAYWKQYGNEKPNNYLDWFSGCILIETYAEVAEKFDEKMMANVAVESSFIANDVFKEEENWELTDNNISVQANQVSFPEVLLAEQHDIFFCVGEIKIKTSFDMNFRDEVGVYPSFGSGYWEMIATLDKASRRDLIKDQDDIMETYFTDSDLRMLPEIRNKIYNDINISSDKTYYELSKEMGFDLGRFYEK